MIFVKRALSIALVALSMLSLQQAHALSTLSGKPIKMEQLVGKGRWTAINIWASTCSICRKTVGHLIEIDQRMPAIDVLGISIDDVEGKRDAQLFIQQNRIRFPNLLSNAAEIDAYLQKHAQETLMGTPTLLLFSPKGKLVAVQPGPVTPTELKNFINNL